MKPFPSDSKCALISLLLKKYSLLSSVPPSYPALIFFFSSEKQMTSPGLEGVLLFSATLFSLSFGQFWTFLGATENAPCGTLACPA